VIVQYFLNWVVTAFLGNVLEAARWFKLVALSAPSRLTLAAADLQ
jgi:hypothetical protein